jgi:hypothetical protein
MEAQLYSEPNLFRMPPEEALKLRRRNYLRAWRARNKGRIARTIDKSFIVAANEAYGERHKLGNVGIIAPGKVAPTERGSDCGFDVYDCDASRAGKYGWRSLGDGCYQAGASTLSCLIEEQQKQIEDSDFGLIFL